MYFFMRVFPSSLVCILAIVLVNGCFYRTESEPPIVYQEWNARYHYDLDKRRLTSTFGNKRIGRNWGRNENGLIDYDRWWGRGPLITENLMTARRKDNDAIREKRWIESEKARLEARRQEIEKEAGIDASKPDAVEDVEKPATEEPLPFIPEPFAPATPVAEELVPPGSLPVPEEPMAPSPFAPLPPDSGLPPLPGEGDGAPPSPFAPLPPL
jgi:hypothetical protein